MTDYKFNVIIWISLIMIALAVAAIDVMSSKIVELTPEKEPVITKIVFNDVWFKISVLLFLIPALFAYYVTKKKRKIFFILLAGMILIFFGLEDVFYFGIKGLIYPEEFGTIDSELLYQFGFVNLMPDELWWLNSNYFITIFGNPVTQFVLFKSTAFALAISFVLVML